jgi:hypothetical protein
MNAITTDTHKATNPVGATTSDVVTLEHEHGQTLTEGEIEAARLKMKLFVASLTPRERRALDQDDEILDDMCDDCWFEKYENEECDGDDCDDPNCSGGHTRNEGWLATVTGQVKIYEKVSYTSDFYARLDQLRIVVTHTEQGTSGRSA